jgi:hypothetical protein
MRLPRPLTLLAFALIRMAASLGGYDEQVADGYLDFVREE